MSKQQLEDIYLPFKRKRRTKGSEALAQGLGPLAQFLWEQEPGEQSIEDLAKTFVGEERGVPTVERALLGAQFILSERIAEDAGIRALLREKMASDGRIASFSTKLAEGKKTKYSAYYEFSEEVRKIPSHRFLAIARGAKEGLLRTELLLDDRALEEQIVQRLLKEPGSPFEPYLRAAVGGAYARLLRPAIENEILADVRKSADESAIRVFRENAYNLLLSPAAGRLTVLGVEPGLRSGCKLAVIDEEGAVCEHATVFPDESDEKRADAQTVLLGLIDRHHVKAIAIGNGTGSREAARFVREAIRQRPGDGLFSTLVNEAGTSAYSASKLAREEFPDLDAALRKAISVARRLQDPLAELVKIEPRSIGVGQYQHDVNQKALREGLHQTVVSCVNRVGADLNTCSVQLLRYVSGMQYGTAQNVVAFREEKGPFTSRAQLLEVPGVGPKVFEQCAGFLRITGGDNPLDSTSVHPEAYPAVEKIAEAVGTPLRELIGNHEVLDKLELSRFKTDTLAEFSLSDIREALLKPGHDPRKRFRPPRHIEGVSEVADLEVGMVIEGTVTNVTDFGAFVDVGVHQDGLVHLSELANRFVEDPRSIVRVGETIKVKVIRVDKELPRVSLSIKALRAGAKTRSRRNVVQKAPHTETPGEPKRKRPKPGEKTRKPAQGGRRAPASKTHTDRGAARSKKRTPKVHKSGDKQPLNTQLAEQLEALREKLGA